MKNSNKSKTSAKQQKSVRSKPLKTKEPSSHLEKSKGEIQATKHDYGKTQFLFPIRALATTNQVFTYGGQKYDIGNWHSGNGFDYQRLIDGCYGHVQNWQLGEDLDPETGLPHLGHAICCLAMLLEHTLTDLGSDTRSKTNKFHTRRFDTRAIVKGPTTKTAPDNWSKPNA